MPEPRTLELTVNDCWNQLATAAFGRLAVITNGLPEIFPLNYALDGHTLVFRTRVGSKLNDLVMYNTVVFEADGWDGSEGWSVIVHGEARVIDGDAELEQASGLLHIPWHSATESEFVRITPKELSGRKSNFAAQRVA